ncbi:histone deacetylase family protein [Phyllobacterium myrsinacearum]|uniref:Acetylpolyamine amidohydrolase n=1 Tax=Phyllobacterium myrsinacearum TaxID=28101 RepID=A0A2S9JAZ4_9HYPH|nr:histone deacetylase family protein [Phyllobacterium myrsinacearum]PRD49929.1 acetylpolyamine amidohydrolase [Phyllobacterium myrsinacearum]PWV86576.1 acetoin utilization deacetylase AcuC-like enzyme [Phyllobacterium myrsinacearum]RZU96928.1 acetoin utilization deacetylase AcuC-like enzyme [Phyllobacterium myrsinacearum]
MLAIYDPRQELHQPLTRLAGGVFRPNLEQADRVVSFQNALRRMSIATMVPADAGDEILHSVHDAGYLDFLATGYAQWRAMPDSGPELRVSAHPNIYMNRLPRNFYGRAGYYQADAGCVIVEGTWPACRASAMTAIDATKRVLGGARTAYALCRPPGHHAYADKAGGFCYLNNTALAAEVARGSVNRVAIIDIDVHHGNGTQAIFYERPDVLHVSVHGDPADLYPFYAGYADECGRGAGEGTNLNLPVPLMSDNAVYCAAVDRGIGVIHQYAPEMLVVALGLDASTDDPFACMRVDRTGFARMGEAIGSMRLPTVIVQEGGYQSPELEHNFEAFLTGFLHRHS